MNRKILTLIISSIILILGLISLISSNYGYITTSIILFSILFNITNIKTNRWLLLILACFQTTTSTINIVMNDHSQILYLLEFAGSIVVVVFVVFYKRTH